MVSGRLRLGIAPILRLLEKGDPGGPKQDIWDAALDEAIQASKRKLVKEIDDFLDEDPGGIQCIIISPLLTCLTRNCHAAKSHGDWGEYARHLSDD